MDGSIAIAEAYIRIEDAVPTSQALERRAARLEEYARSVGLDVFGPGLTFEIEVEPGSIIERCKAFAPIVAVVAGVFTISSTTVAMLDRDYGPDGQIRKTITQLHEASKSFSDKIIARVVPGHHETPPDDNDDDTDRSAVRTRRYTLTLGKLKRALDAAHDLGTDPKSKKHLLEFQRRLALLLADCDDDEERAQLINILQEDELVRMALVQGFGSDYVTLAESPPEASDFVVRTYGSAEPGHPTGRKRLTAAERRALPKPVVRRFST